MSQTNYVSTLRSIRDRLGKDWVGATAEERRQRLEAEIANCPKLARILADKLRGIDNPPTPSAPAASGSDAARSPTR